MKINIRPLIGSATVWGGVLIVTAVRVVLAGTYTTFTGLGYLPRFRMYIIQCSRTFAKATRLKDPASNILENLYPKT